MNEKLNLFDEVIEKVRRRENFSPLYKKIVIDLGSLRSEEVFNLSGFILHVIDATDTLTSIDVRINESTADLLTLKKGARLITPFYRFFLSNVVQAGKTLTIAIAPLDTLWRLELEGQVIASIDSIVNPVLSKEYLLKRAEDGKMWEAGFRVTAVAAQFSYGQIKNPVGSGKIYAVTAIHFENATAGSLFHQVIRRDTNLATIVTGPKNVKTGLEDSSLELRKENNAASLPATPGADIQYIEMGINPGDTFSFPRTYYILGAGSAIVATTTVVNQPLEWSFQVIEL